ncbi:DUF952 domain-containing protein [Segetibacter sp. 3557_3]|uniref:DUF952 domain-containing protein n=1 Tax=Segetibacter sp. 3557_3 TaxID=2547429 RepID=UPI001058BC01|nr:DUF952 domain-containing protein [Segetibacter sp. 3557_3]TDH29132.1 DUF952 domain-containing protein [Segetibacter sp. 3557_3]
MTEKVFHITNEKSWLNNQRDGFYLHPSLESEGFIHCCTATQIEGVLARYFAGAGELLQLEINTNLLEAILKYEYVPASNDVFPHLYGPLNITAVSSIKEINNYKK